MTAGSSRHGGGIGGTGDLDARDTIAAVFRETYCRMLSGDLLRDVVDQVERGQLHLLR